MIGERKGSESGRCARRLPFERVLVKKGYESTRGIQSDVMMPAKDEIVIRLSTDEDSIGIRKVQVETWKSAYKGILPDEILDELTVQNPPVPNKQPSPELVSSRRSYVALNEAGNVIGFTAGGIPRDRKFGYDSEVWAIYVSPNQQSKGIGKKLFDAILSDLSKTYSNMILWTLEKNNSSRKFYESLGGKLFSETVPFECNGKVVATSVGYIWEMKSRKK